jgi:hypothetical protein
MRIRNKVALVGGIPITIAAAIAVIAWLLLSAAERTRNGAVLAGSVYRDLLGVMTERNEYIRASTSERSLHVSRLTDLASKSYGRLETLSALTDNPNHQAITTETRGALDNYRNRMWELMQVTIRNDRLIAEMSARAASLVELTDKARERQHASNTDVIASLTDGDRRLRLSRDIVDRAYELQAANGQIALEEAQRAGGVLAGERSSSATQLSFEFTRLRNIATDLTELLRDDGQAAAASELTSLMRNLSGSDSDAEAPPPDPSAKPVQVQLAEWVERLIKVHSTEQRALHEEVAQLLTYSVNAAETEQVTQNIAITTLKLGRRTSDALANRDVAAVEQILSDSKPLAETVASLPISPLIQTEMIDAIANWRDGLATTADGLRGQNQIIAGMDMTANAMIASAGNLNDLFTNDADRIGQAVRTILVLGAAIGLLLGSGTAFILPRSDSSSLVSPMRSIRRSASR